MLSFYPLLTFAGSFLLFLIQPIAGKTLLPVFGGAPAVWLTCLMFFQGVLFAGYWLAHAVPGPMVRFVFPALLVLQWSTSAAVRPEGGPVVGILWQLMSTVGPVALGLSMLSPLLQRLYRDRTGEEPYRLYSFSNAGSLLALLAYPVVIEPFVRLSHQHTAWLAGAALVFIAILTQAPRTAGPLAAAALPAWRSIAAWAAFSACGSALLSATTNQLTQEVAATPFLWVLPLAVFLATFIFTFESDRWYNPRLFGLVAALAAMGACMAVGLGATMPLWARTGVYLLALFAGCMVCFGELVRARPPAESLTVFYLAVAGGGALGSFFIAVVSPLLFKQIKTEFLVVLILCLGVRLLGWQQERALGAARFAPSLLAAAAVAVVLFREDDYDIVRRTRNFFGAVQVHVAKDDLGLKKVLTHGSILHGVEYQDADKRAWATTYYGRLSGVGLVLSRLPLRPARVAAVGLGVGTIAAYGREGDVYRFFEINPDVAEIAQKDFHYLAGSAARVEIVLGDARLKLQEERELFDVIVVDAFSSDAIPTHLLTAECGRLYQRLLKPGGALMLHLSNRALDLLPVAEGLARHIGFRTLPFHRLGDTHKGGHTSTWMLLTQNEELLQDEGLRRLSKTPPGVRLTPLLWTDDFSSLWPVLK